ncbi:MAG: hypothetical protein V3V22_05020 [Methylococcales bacterium]
MIEIKIKETKYFLIIMAISLIALTSCSSGPPVYNSLGPVSSDPLVTQKLVGTAIMSASRFYEEWTITKLRPGEMKGVLNYGPHLANVSIPYDTNQFRIVYKDSRNFAFDDEEQSIHPRYNDWVKKLESRINEEIQYHIQLAQQQAENRGQQ